MNLGSEALPGSARMQQAKRQSSKGQATAPCPARWHWQACRRKACLQSSSPAARTAQLGKRRGGQIKTARLGRGIGGDIKAPTRDSEFVENEALLSCPLGSLSGWEVKDSRPKVCPQISFHMVSTEYRIPTPSTRAPFGVASADGVCSESEHMVI